MSMIFSFFYPPFASDIEQLNRFPCGGYSDESTIVYLSHPCKILTSLEALGYRVVASSSTAVKQDYNEYMWTMREVTSENEQLAFDSASTVDRDNLANTGREALVNSQFHHSQVDLPDE
ncbi:uncharacterized protein LOC129569775 isoform X2 [Sitodiplosis mosellana]|uniref:uncharacterized protein LOC129569775 isoform X2 n=1 Tax=Sitodiplosis mosellana TaxID=263140 RepID=UPI002443F0CD|nr:uncharacterized protein LOC129569775 isoform X2 [Sitodiplosis mosellana]